MGGCKHPYLLLPIAYLGTRCSVHLQRNLLAPKRALHTFPHGRNYAEIQRWTHRRLREAIGLDEQRQKRIVFDITCTMVSELLVRMQKILNLVTNYQNQEYFNNISPVQALVHLVMDDYRPHDIEL